MELGLLLLELSAAAADDWVHVGGVGVFIDIEKVEGAPTTLRRCRRRRCRYFMTRVMVGRIFVLSLELNLLVDFILLPQNSAGGDARHGRWRRRVVLVR